MAETMNIDYRDKVILAPMVRMGTLPTRLLALKYGADLVYSEEIIDHKILSAQRIINEVLGTVDYVLSDTTLVFRTHPLEKGRIVFQMGTAEAGTALKAAKKIEKDVAAIDINMGCPKEFSIKGGMGAALLKRPETVEQILTSLVKGLSIPVTCKIRLHPELEDSKKFVKMIEGTGVWALGIHGRLTEERPRHPNRNHSIKQLAETLNIPVIANGGSKDISCYEDIEKFKQETGCSSVMIARAAQWNTSVFRKEGRLPVKEVVKEYLKLAIDMDNPFPNTKYCILSLMHADMDQKQGLDTQDSKCLEDICEIWGYTDYFKEVKRNRKLKQDSIDKYHGIKRRKTEAGHILIEMPIRFIKKDYPTCITPKLKLYEWTKRRKIDKPEYNTRERSEDRCYKSVLSVDGKSFTASMWEKSKQLAEQAAAIIGLIVLGETDGSKPNTESPNDEIIKAWKQEFQSAFNKEYPCNHGQKTDNCDRTQHVDIDKDACVSQDLSNITEQNAVTIADKGDLDQDGKKPSGATDDEKTADVVDRNDVIVKQNVSDVTTTEVDINTDEVDGSLSSERENTVESTGCLGDNTVLCRKRKLDDYVHCASDR